MDLGELTAPLLLGNLEYVIVQEADLELAYEKLQGKKHHPWKEKAHSLTAKLYDYGMFSYQLTGMIMITWGAAQKNTAQIAGGATMLLLSAGHRYHYYYKMNRNIAIYQKS